MKAWLTRLGCGLAPVLVGALFYYVALRVF